MTNDLFLKDLESKLSSTLSDEEAQKIKEKSFKYLSVNSDVSGEQFFDEFVLKSFKDYPTDDMRYYQAVRELKSRIHNMFEETINFQKKQIDLELAELDLEDLKADLRKDENDKRTLLKVKSKEIDVNQLRVQSEFMKQKVQIVSREVEDFTNLCEKYGKNGVKPFEQARVEEMEKKIEARYINHVVHGIPLTAPEMAFYYNEQGIMIPPKGTIDKLLELGRPDLAQIEYVKSQAVNGEMNLLDRKEEILKLTQQK